jgi:hypothetical protein
MTASTAWSSMMSYIFDRKGGIGVSWRHSSGRGISKAPCFAPPDSDPATSSSSGSRKVIEGNSILIGSGNEEEDDGGGGCGLGLVEYISMVDCGEAGIGENSTEKVSK